MSRVLLVKTSSLGDVVHNFPAVSDLRAAVPNVTIDWVTEEALAPLARLHRGVTRVIPAAVRRWRSSFWRAGTRRELRAFIDMLRADRYDAVIDTQGLLKSALITRVARGKRYGPNWRSSREPLFFFYDRTLHASWAAHAVERNRTITAQVFGYTVDGRVDYGISAAREEFPWIGTRTYAALIHGTSAREKLWPERNWIQLAKAIAKRGVVPVLLSGSAVERARSEAIAAAVRDAIVAPRLDIGEVASLIAGASSVIGVDTGLTHLGVALGMATVGIYVATDPANHGLYGSPRAVNVGNEGVAPGVADVMAAWEALGA